MLRAPSKSPFGLSLSKAGHPPAQTRVGHIALRQAQGERWLVGLAMFGVLAALPAHAQNRRVDVAPYIEVGQVLTADLQDGDVLTYSTVAAGIDLSVETRRTQVQISYKYEHRFAYQKDVGDEGIHSGLARVGVAVAPGFSVEAGAIATRARSDMRGDAPGNLAGNVENISQLYSGYAGPTLSTKTGPVNLNAAYRFGYTKAEAPTFSDQPAGQPPLDVYDSATSHLAVASASVRAGTVLPVGVTVAGAYQREDASQLDQRYESANARGDVVLPVGRGVALTAGVGYEKIEISQRDPMLDGTGNPVTDSNGRFVTDPSSPRRLAYDIDGVFWDAGVIYRPNRRLTLEARVGRRYDSWSYTGSLSWDTGRGSGLQIGVYDGVQTFSRQLNDSLAALPTGFMTTSDPFGDQFNGCVFGTSGAAAGGCMNDVFQSIATASYRARGVDAVYAINRGRLRMGVGGGYANRRFFAPDAPPAGSGFTVNGVEDESFYGQFFVSDQVGPRSQLSGNIFGNYFQSGLPGAPGIWGYGGNTAYSYSIGRLGATASLGVYGVSVDGENDQLNGQALVGMRYQF